jgi:signal transduction histidine kinase
MTRAPARTQSFATAPASVPMHGSPADFVAAADEARRRLERDLHDGAQQRFVFASLCLAQAVAVTRGTPAEALVAEARAHVQQGLVELRELAHGLHPAVLSRHGLATALRGIAARAPVPVELQVTRERAAASVETAVYFTIAEALTNVAKHARATRVWVTAEIVDGELRAEVRDDGRGGAAATAGSGLRGLAERLEALGGALSIDSPRGGPTSVRARVPCA